MTPDTKEMSKMAEEATLLLKAFAHPARLLICCQLRAREMSVGEIEEQLGIRQPRLSRELAKLREEGLVETRREAKSVFYRLSATPRVGAMMDAICAVMLGKPVSAPAHSASIQQDNRKSGSGMFARVQDI